MANLKTETRADQKLGEVHLFVAEDHWAGIKKLAKSRNVTASEQVRRLIAAELRKTSKGIVAPF